jgi:uncharacterized membrane protein YfcA
MELTNIIILVLFGLAAGFVNTISAAGSLIALPALMFTGLTAGEANATNRVAVLFQNLAAWGGFRSKGMKTDSLIWWLTLAAIPGAVLGAWFSLKIPDELFNKILATVMVVFLAVIFLNPIKPSNNNIAPATFRKKIAAFVLYFFVGLYGGFIQAGTGFFMMAGCILLLKFDLPKTNFYKAVIMFCYTVAAFLVFLWKGNINWMYGIVISIGTTAGGYLGSIWTIQANEALIKKVMAVIILLLAVYLWFFK